MTAPNVSAGRNAIPGKTLAVIAAGAVLVLIAALFVVRATTGSSSPDAPAGLSLTADDGKVKAVWNTVSGADEYILIRDGGTVVYRGEDTNAVDLTAATGEHSYRLRAENNGRWSAESADTKVTVVSGWGQDAPLIAQVPQVLPQTPAVTGWRDINCRSMVRALKIERGSSDAGNGDPLVKARLHCFNKDLIVQPAWMTSKNATDQFFADVSKSAPVEPVTWRHGTGYVIEEDQVIYLRFAERDDLVFVVKLDKADKAALVDLANSMPFE